MLCTATQPALQGETPYLQGFAPDWVRDIIPPPQATQQFAALSRVRYEVPAVPWSWADIATDLGTSLSRGDRQIEALLNKGFGELMSKASNPFKGVK
ncbi:hypothetical protein XM38_035520 [Halomicronema hongdechloris C2206]|uniref:Uncharacterized protein n=1 Tax=Halomicronema hongdechloris C2206 TaxID=1641165 RepID=A0A1Z3HQJ9_9CYAN|nr:hypothetical protein XM38_035520 [Halomicronema hongdechloris C2206]